MADRNLQPSQTDLERLFSALDPDRDRAAEEYLRLRQKLVAFFHRKGLTSADDLADETLDRVARRLGEGETVADVSAYLYGVARSLQRSVLLQQRRMAAHSTPEASALHADDAADAPSESELTLAALETCLAKLGPEARKLMLEYYSPKRQDRRALANELGMPVNALRIRMHRLRTRLENCIRQALVEARSTRTSPARQPRE